jgi:DNA replication protein DnaC
MDSLGDLLNRMNGDTSRGTSQTSSKNNDDEPPTGTCPRCGQENVCNGLGVIRYEVPIDDPRFGKLFRCPNNPVQADAERQERLRRLSNLDAYKDKTFDTFVIETAKLTPSEEMSLRTAYKMASSFADQPEGWLLLEGTFGCGKTHLAAAIGNERLKQGDLVLFITVPDLLDHLRSTFGPSSETGYDQMFDRIRNAPLLILDDLGAENSSQWAQEKMFQLLNHRYSRRLPTVITTNVDVDTIDPRVRSRLLDQDLIHRVKITAPDYRTSAQNQHQQFSNLSLYLGMTFDNFDTSTRLNGEERQNLELALEAAVSYSRAPKGWLVLLSNYYASGKTHLAAAIAQQRQQMGDTVMFVTVPDLLDYLRTAYNPGVMMNFDQRFNMVRNAPLLVLDNLGTESATPWAKEKLFQLIDHRYITNRPTVITTAKPLEQIDARIQSRLVDQRVCRIIRIIAPDYPSRIRNARS